MKPTHSSKRLSPAHLQKKSSEQLPLERDFVLKNILSTSDIQSVLEDFIISKYNKQLFQNKNIDTISEKLGWDRETVLAYFTKTMAL